VYLRAVPLRASGISVSVVVVGHLVVHVAYERCNEIQRNRHKKRKVRERERQSDRQSGREDKDIIYLEAI
jgi:hypothetical protein